METTLDQKAVKRLLKKENTVILELGAHKGSDTQKFLQEFKNIRIYCFEPNPTCASEFRKNINNNKCVLIEAAVSDKDGKAPLNVSGGWPNSVPKIFRATKLSKYYLAYKDIFRRKKIWDLSSSIKKTVSSSKAYPWLVFDKTVEIETVKLDTWVRNNNISFIDFIWSDLQGAEKDMIEGAVETLKITNYLYTEYGETSTYPEAMTRSETIELLRRHNFKIIPEYSSEGGVGNLLFKNKRL